MKWTDFDAALFDLDGVITPTAEVHMAAWSQVFNDFLHAEGKPADYSDADYYRDVDGRPRYDGVRAVLASRGITLPEGTPDDPPDARTVCGLGNRKNQAFNDVLVRDGIAPYPGSRALVDHLVGLGIPMAIVSSSRNAASVLARAAIDDRFRVIVDGLVARDHDLPGKPAPDTFLYAATQLGVAPARAVVFEDAVSGVAAGRAGAFGRVIGVDRGVGTDALRAAGADRVVTDLAELIEEGRR